MDGSGFGVWGSGFGVWSVGFGDWGLGFEVWGLGLGFGARGSPECEAVWMGAGSTRELHFFDATKASEVNKSTPFRKMARRHRKVDVRLPGKENSNSHGARSVHQIISMTKWIRTSRSSINNFLCGS